MLRALILFILFVGGTVFVFTWLRKLRKQLARFSRTLDSGELRELSRQAKNSSVLRRALDLRAQIQEALAGRQDRTRIATRVDAAVRRVASQENLRDRIRTAIARNEAATGSPDREDINAFEARQVMLGRLEEQTRMLDQEGEKAVAELSNLHLALLDVSATEAIRGREALSEALEELESAGTSARRQAQAEAEVERFLTSKR